MTERDGMLYISEDTTKQDTKSREDCKPGKDSEGQKDDPPLRIAKKESYENNNKGSVEVENQDTPTEEEKKEKELDESQSINLDDKKEEENYGTPTVLTISATEIGENEIDLNMLKQKPETEESENDDTKHLKTGARNCFVNYLDNTCMKCTPIDLIQKKKGILSLYELCKLSLGCNNDTCAALASYTKMHAYFKKFHLAGNLKVTKMEGDDVVTFKISPKGFYGKQKEKTEGTISDDGEAATSMAGKKNEEEGRIFLTRHVQVKKTRCNKIDKTWQKIRIFCIFEVKSISIVRHICCRDT